MATTTTNVLQKYQPTTQPQLGADGLYLKNQLQQISNSINQLIGGVTTGSGFGGSTPIWSGRHIYDYTPVFDLASGTLSVDVLFETTGVTVPAGDTYNDIRFSQTDGSNNTYTVGAGSVASAIYSSAEALSGSDSAGNVYGAVLHAINDGPGTVRGAHLGGFANTGSTGLVSAAGLQIQPVSTSAGAWGCFASLTSSGANGIAVAYGIETQGDTYALGVGSTVAPVGYATACYRAWMGTASGTNARSFQTLQNDGTEIQYIKKTGEVVSSTGLIGGSETNGITITLAAVTRNNSAGSMTIAAGTGTGNGIALQTNNTTRLSIQDNVVVATGAIATLSAAVSGLPAASSAGIAARAFVTDSTVTLAAGLGNTVVGGGANKVPVYSDGTNWKIG